MLKLFQSKSFYGGFVLGILLMFFINFIDFVGESGSLLGMPYIFGVPFSLFVEDGYSYELYMKTGINNSSRILMFGLIADIFFALFVGFAYGVIFRFNWIQLRIFFARVKKNRQRKFDENKVFSIFDEV